MLVTDLHFIKSKIIHRKSDAHKGDFGKVLIYAGSVGMAGAGILCAKAALRSGAGLVRILLPDFSGPLLGIFQSCVPEATCVCYTPGMDLNEYTAIAAGCGLGKSKEAAAILKDILTRYEGNLVLDADALNIISASENSGDLVNSSPADIVMTPHIGEAKRLLTGNFDDIDWRSNEHRRTILERISEVYGCSVVLKGENSLIGNTKELFLNPTGNPGMATGGSGDVLTGIIAALSAQGYSLIDSAVIGTYIHGLSGDIAARKLGHMSMISSDIVKYLPAAFCQVY